MRRQIEQSREGVVRDGHRFSIETFAFFFGDNALDHSLVESPHELEHEDEAPVNIFQCAASDSLGLDVQEGRSW
jgi:hypothetical protein